MVTGRGGLFFSFPNPSFSYFDALFFFFFAAGLLEHKADGFLPPLGTSAAAKKNGRKIRPDGSLTRRCNGKHNNCVVHNVALEIIFVSNRGA